MARAQILVVAESRMVARTLQTALQASGYSVPAVSPHGMTAVECAERVRPDLVLMDLTQGNRQEALLTADVIKERLGAAVVCLIERNGPMPPPYPSVSVPFLDKALLSAVQLALESHREAARTVEMGQSLRMRTSLPSSADARVAAATTTPSARARLPEFHEAVEQTTDALAVLREGRIVHVNPAWVQWLGYLNVGELAGKPIEELIHPDDRSKARQALEAFESRRHPTSPIRFRFLTRSGDVRTWETTTYRTIQFDGKPALLYLARDVTEKIQMQENMQQANHRSLMAAVMRASLSQLSDKLHALRAKPESASAVDDARTSAERVAMLDTDLHALSPDGPEARTYVDIREVAQTAVRLMRPWMDGCRVVLETSDAPLVEATHSGLLQVLLNLLMNARQAFPASFEGDKDVTVRVQSDAMGHALVEVEDGGVGMLPHVQRRIFQPFYTTGSGMGLGLAVSKAIVEDARGEMSVTSQLGSGSIFRVVLPPARGQEMRH